MKRAYLTLIALFAAFPAMAETPSPPTPPRLRPVYEPDGTLRFCLAESFYPDQRKITFAYAASEALNIGVTIPHGRFQQSRRYDLNLTLDNQPARKVRAAALSDDTLLLEMGVNPSFISKIEESGTLYIGSGKKDVAFALPAMGPLLESLIHCAKGEPLAQEATSPVAAEPPPIPPEAPTAKPASPTAVAKPTPPPSRQADTGFPPDLKDFLERAGLANVTPLPMDEIPPESRVADYLWETGNILGGVRNTPVPEDISLSDLVGLHLKGLKEKCGGYFNAELQKEQTTAGALLRYAEVQCSFEGDPLKPTVAVSLLFSLSPNNDLTVFTFEGLEKDRAEIVAARDKIARHLWRKGS